MELRHIRYFCAVAESLNFTRAAERIHVAQSALSRQIRDLEDEIGADLLVRTTTHVQLTDAGRYFRDSANKILTQLAIAVTGVQEVAHGKSGVLRIASDWRIPIGIIPETIAAFRRSHPKITVEFTDCSLGDQLKALRNGDIHVGFLPDLSIGARNDLEILPMYHSSLVVVVSAAHSLAGRKAIMLRELARERWLSMEDTTGSDSRTYTIQMCRTAGFTPKFGRSARSAAGIVSLVAAGEGISLLPPGVIPSDSAGVSILPTDCAPLSGNAVWLTKSTSPIVSHYIELLRSHLSARKPPKQAKQL